MREFFRAGDALYRVSEILEIDTQNLVDYRVSMTMRDGRVVDLAGADAIELVLLAKPSALEGQRLRTVRHAWALHNLVGHPGMQLLAWLGRPKLGILLHDATTPRPKLP